MLKRYAIDATHLSQEEISRLGTFLDGYAFCVASNCTGVYEVLLEEHQSLEGLPQIPAECIITQLSKK